ncbi:MAG: Sec-independent protein translocase protein TatB [Pseudorhodobacter sp.]
MFDIGWTELLVVGVVALIVIGPKDLPEMFRTLGRFTAKMRGMARDFQRAMDSAADEAGVKDLKNVASDLKKATSAKSLGLDAVKDAATKFEQWDPMKSARPAPAKPKPTPDPSAPAAPAAAAPERGPATQALAETQATRRESRKTAAVTTPPAAATQTAAKPAAKPAARKAAAKLAAARPAATSAPEAPAKASAKSPAKVPTAAKPAAAKPRAPRKPAAKGDAT